MGESGNLRVDVDGNASGFAATMQAVKMHAKQMAGEVNADLGRSWGGIGKGFAGGIAGAFSFEGIKSFVGGVFEKAGSIKDLSEQFDLSTDSVQLWQKACDKAGISTNTFYRALETLRAKRAEAIADPKKMTPFDDLGLAGAVRGSGTDEDLLKQILGSGASRPQMAEIIGKRGVMLKAALGEMGTDVPMDADTIEELDKLEKESAGFWSRLATEATKAFWTRNDVRPFLGLRVWRGGSPDGHPALFAVQTFAGGTVQLGQLGAILRNA